MWHVIFDAGVRLDQPNFGDLSWDRTRNCGFRNLTPNAPKFRFRYYSNLCQSCKYDIIFCILFLLYLFFNIETIYILFMMYICMIFAWYNIVRVIWIYMTSPPTISFHRPLQHLTQLAPGDGSARTCGWSKRINSLQHGPNFSSYVGLIRHRVGPLLIWFMSVFLGNKRQLFGMIRNSIWSTCHKIDVTKMTNLIIYVAAGR